MKRMGLRGEMCQVRVYYVGERDTLVATICRYLGRPKGIGRRMIVSDIRCTTFIESECHDPAPPIIL